MNQEVRHTGVLQDNLHSRCHCINNDAAAPATAAAAAVVASAGKPGSVSAGGKSFEVTAAMVEIKRVKKKLAGRNYVPSVIEPSFGIGRILYCIFEHSYYTREVGALCLCVSLGGLFDNERLRGLGSYGASPEKEGFLVAPTGSCCFGAAACVLGSLFLYD